MGTDKEQIQINTDNKQQNNVTDSPLPQQSDKEEVGGSDAHTVYFQDEDVEEVNNELFVDQDDDQRGLMGLIKNLSELGEASIVTGSSLGKLLLDPQNIYKDINFTSMVVAQDILSPIQSVEEEETASSEQLIDCENQLQSKHNIEESLSFLPEIEEDTLFEYRKKKRRKNKKKKKQRRHSFADSSTDHHSDNAHERYNERKRRRRKEKLRRSRSHSPPLTADEMAPHEVVWEKFTSMFASDKHKQSEKKDLYASLENTPEYESKQQTLPEIENDIDANDQTFSSIA